MIRQSVVGSAEIVALVFYTQSKIPFSSDQKPMVVREVIVQRITVTELGFLKIAIECVSRLPEKRSCEFSSGGVGEG
jgi:hypothetical protein